MIIFNEIERDDNTIRLKLTPSVEQRKRANFSTFDVFFHSSKGF